MGVSSKLDSTRATLGAGAGTSRYMPPEQLNGRLSSKVDIWAFGCVMLQLITGNRPFHSIDNDIAATMQIFNKQNPLTFALKNSKAQMHLVHDNLAFREILSSCFKVNYKERPSAQDLCNTPFFNEFITN